MFFELGNFRALGLTGIFVGGGGGGDSGGNLSESLLDVDKLNYDFFSNL